MITDSLLNDTQHIDTLNLANESFHCSDEISLGELDGQDGFGFGSKTRTRSEFVNLTPDNKYSNDAHNRFSDLLSVLPMAVLVLDKTGRVSQANNQAQALLGQPLNQQLWRDVIERAFSPKADDGHEVSMRNGKRVKIDISALTHEKGQLIVITDLTQTRELQSRVGHMQRLSSLGKMVASLAHQVRTPLSSALLYAENLRSMPLQEEIANQFSNKLCIRLRELEAQVNDMLLFAKSSDKQIVEKVDVHSLLAAAVAQVEAQFKQSEIVIQSQSEQIPHKILCNTTAIQGALTNLLINAMQALNGSSQNLPLVTLSAHFQEDDTSTPIRLRVSDNGDGIPEATLARIFEPFYTTKTQGTGLGLAVVQTVARSHKGKVVCGNNTDQGAYFELQLPAFETQQKQHSGVTYE